MESTSACYNSNSACIRRRNMGKIDLTQVFASFPISVAVQIEKKKGTASAPRPKWSSILFCQRSDGSCPLQGTLCRLAGISQPELEHVFCTRHHHHEHDRVERFGHQFNWMWAPPHSRAVTHHCVLLCRVQEHVYSITRSKRYHYDDCSAHQKLLHS